MKIAIDGFNLGMIEGTGIATYGRELASVLTGAGHDVCPIYGFERVAHDTQEGYSQFIQRLGVDGQASKMDILKWLPKFLSGIPLYLLQRPFKVHEVLVNEKIALGKVKSKIPNYSMLLNSPSIYRISQAYSFFLSRNLQLKLPKDVDIFHLTCPLPISALKIPKVVTVHDIIPLVAPASTTVNLRHYCSMVKTSISDASMIFAVSETAKNDLINFYNISDDKVHVTYQSVDIPKEYRDLNSKDISLYLQKVYKDRIKYKNYFLFYGAVEPKKNVEQIINAFSRANTDFPIVIVGKNGWLHNEVDRLVAKMPRSKVLRIPYLPFSELMFLLKGARGLVFPSFYEGFGLPVLEAMQMGCPVITSNVSSLPEVGGDAVHYVDPYDVKSISDAIEKFCDDSEYVEDLITKGYVQSQKFSSDNYLARLQAGYQKALN